MMWKCSVCGKDLSTKYSLARHMRRHFEETPQYSCEFCGFRLHHDNASSAYKTKWQCHICGSCLSNKYSLERHMSKHSDVKHYFKCNICNNLFAWQSSLLRHQTTIHGVVLTEEQSSKK
ncbi:Zinc finger protein 836 like protein [Argiope bruennichi]|uniref:Zinc finger protein 836 like protein n=1 Tax=Argiope bruennichi TaxID=94029 RepID=A0A8T0E658_ARGBR|nr:Zinc finger protein 836 like protein [Argiope bruennichi]